MFLPATFWGSPALGWTEIGNRVRVLRTSSASSMPFGPTEQFIPTTSTFSPATAWTKLSSGAPRRSFTSSLTVTCAMRGMSLSSFANCLNRLHKLGDLAERLENDQIDAAVEQPAELLREDLPRLLVGEPTQWFDLNTQGPDRPGDKGGLLGGSLGRPCAAEVDVVDAGFQAVRGELEAVGTEGIGLDHIGTGSDVVAVYLANEVGVGQVEFVKARVDEDTLLIEKGAHATVKDNDVLLQSVAKRSRCCHGCPHRSKGKLGNSPRESIEAFRSCDSPPQEDCLRSPFCLHWAMLRRRTTLLHAVLVMRDHGDCGPGARRAPHCSTRTCAGRGDATRREATIGRA